MMNQLSPSRPGCSQWLIFLLAAFWLAAVPLGVTGSLSALADSPPYELVQLELVAPGDPLLSEWALALFATFLSLSLHLLVFVPLYLGSRGPGRRFVRTTAGLLIAIALYQTLNALAILPWLGAEPIPPYTERTLAALLRLTLTLSFLLGGLAWIEARRQDQSLLRAWRQVGLRKSLNPTAIWLALASVAVAVWPWVLVGSLGSVGTTLANLLQTLPGALGSEILFRGFAFNWLWRVAASPADPASPQGGRRSAAIASLILSVAFQGGMVLPDADWSVLFRFSTALLLGLLVTELTVRGGGSIWPAFVVHYLYLWFGLAFADPRSQEQVLHWLAQTWAAMALGGVGLALWLGRKVAESYRGMGAPGGSLGGLVAAASVTCITWGGIVLLYLVAGVPGFHPDGFIIYLEEQADLSGAESIADPAERRALVYRTLVETAKRSQTPLWAELERRGVRYRPHYLINAIEVLERPGLRRAFEGQPGVAAVLFQPGMRRYPHSVGLPNLDPQGPSGVEWNVRQVGADRVWDLGYTGQGVVVGSADSGVVWQHPALKEAYLGWNGGAASHDYHWFDAWDGRAEPWDDTGHGTHTIGTVVGQDGENKVGLAPGARWIACRNMRHGLGNPGSYLSCMEFLFAPFPMDGDPLSDGDPARGADVVNNSWGCPRMEGCLPDTLRLAVEHLRGAGQMMVVSAGNDGPACGTVQDPPALYDAVLSVGATDSGDRAAGFSSRGPVTVDGSQRPKPDLVAPGVNIRSSVPGGYASLPGTSMAGPHVAGAVALLWSMEPALIGDVERTEAILTQTAQRLTVEAICPGGPEEVRMVCGCGDDAPDSVPNQVYGWGQVDAWAAAQSLLGGP